MRSLRCLFTAKAALLALVLFAAPAQAQNSICPDVALGDSSNRCANTRFVTGQIAASGLIIGTTVINGGTSPDILYDNGGVLGNLPVTGTAGNVVLSLGPSISNAILTTPSLGVATGTSLALGGATIGTDALAVTGTSSFSSHIVGGGNITLGTANTFSFSGRSIMQSPADGDIRLANNNGTSFTSLKLGGTTASFPELKRNGTAINFRLADDSANAPITASTGGFTGAVTLGTNGGSAGQIIANGSTSGSATVAAQASAGSASLLWPTGSGTLASTGTSPITVDAVTGAIGCATCNVTGSNVGSVSNSDGTLTISPTVGTVVASLALSHANTWLSTQTFPSPIMTGTPVLAAPSATTLIVGSSATLPASAAIAVFTNNATTLPTTTTGTVVQIGGGNASGPQVVLDGFASNPTLSFRRANTSAASPSALAANDVIMNFGGTGYGTSGYAASNRLRIAGFASETWTDTAQGTYTSFFTTPTGGTATTEAVRFNPSGGLGVGTTTTDPGAGAILANTSIKSQSATAGIGYATGSGGPVTQTTNRNTGVTLNTINGAITLVSAVNSAVSGATANSFTVTDSAVAATDVVKVVQKSGTDLYEIFVTNVAAGSFKLTFFTTGGTSTEQPVFNFVVIKAVAS